MATTDGGKADIAESTSVGPDELDALWSPELFGLTPEEYRTIADIALHGDGLTNPRPDGKILRPRKD